MKKDLTQVPNLEFRFKDVGGAYNSEGQSRNVWGLVPFPMEVLSLADEAKKNGHKACVWTGYDDSIYSSSFDRRKITPDYLRNTVVDILNGDREFFNKKLLYKIKLLSDTKGLDAVLRDTQIMAELSNEIELSERGIPSNISATFKSCFRKYAAVVENLGMYIAIELDMPTSYNYIVGFDKDEYPEIIQHYNSSLKVDRLQPLGIVSVDFLQNKEVPEYEEDYRVKTTDGFDWITIKKNFSGDTLSPFLETLNSSVNNAVSGEQNLIENWLRGIHRTAEASMSNFTEEEKKACIENVDSRVVRSTLLREFLGDCDFASYNGGIVTNSRKHTFRYAPNFDYGECFNGLVRNRLDASSNQLSEDVLKSLPADIRERLEKQATSSQQSIEEISKSYASASSEENLRYIMQHYPQYAKEFTDNLSNALSRNAFDKLVDRYTKLYHKGVPLLTESEAEDFKQYLRLRGEWIISMANQITHEESSM